MNVLDVKKLVAGYGKLAIIRDVSVVLNSGETLAVIGPNGSGKSTFAKSVIGFTTIFSGSILFDGKDVTYTSPEKRVRMGIGYLPQTQNVFPDLTVEENIEMGGYSLKKPELRNRMREVLEMFPELVERLKQKAGTMSGGERQMLAMARLLMTSPRLIIVDEPSAGLSPKMVDRIYEKIDFLRREKVTMILIEQHALKALRHSDRTIVMVGGRIVLEGPSVDVRTVDLGSIFFQPVQTDVAQQTI
ncbi:MAG: ABC transporter ATP-binding protein [Candidatus Caldarchaeum sp.]